MSSETEIRPFRVDMPDEAITDLRRRIAATRWPSQELVADRSQGVQLATLQELARYWAHRLRLARVRGEAERAAAVHDRDRRGRHPLHPRQVAARERAAADHDARLARLGHRVARGRRPAHRPDRARRLRRRRVRPRAAVPARLRLLRRAGRGRLGSRPRRTGLGGADAPPRLRPLRRPGRRRGRQRHRHAGPPGTRGAARHPPQPAPDGAGRPPPAEPSEAERAALDAIATFRTSGSGYFIEQATRPQTIGYALLDSPVALAAWMLDHDTDAYYKISRAFLDKQPSGNLTPDHIVDNITLYWLTGTGTSAAREYWETGQAASPRGRRAGPPQVSVPVGFTDVPRRDLPGPAQLGREGLSHPHLLQRGRTGAATSPPGKSPNCSRPRSGQHSGRSASQRSQRALPRGTGRVG